MMTVYLAARYSRHQEMQQYASDLRAAGFQVSSSWIDGGHEIIKEDISEVAQAKRRQFAELDLADLASANMLISFY